MKPRTVPADAVPQIGVLHGTGLTITDVDDAFLAIVGYSRDEFFGTHRADRPLKLIETLDHERMLLRQAQMAGEFSSPYPKIFRHHDGSIVPTLVVAGLIDPAEETWIAYAVTLGTGTERFGDDAAPGHSDATLRLLAGLLRERTRLVSMLDAANVLIWATDSSLRLVGANERFQQVQERYTGRRMLTGDPLLAANYLHDAEAEWEVWYRRALTGETFRTRLDSDVGRVVDLAFSPILDVDATVIGATVVGTDVTAAHRATEDLVQREALLRIAADLGRIAGWVTTVPDREVTLSDALAATLGVDSLGPYSLEETLSWYSDSNRPRVRAAVEACITDGTPFDLELHTDLPSRPSWIRVIGEAQRNDGGIITAVHGAVVDISEQRGSEQRVRDQSLVLDNSTEAILVRDLDGRITYWNRAAEELYGWSAEEAIGRHIAELVDAGDLDKFHDMTEILWTQGEWSGRIQNTDRFGRTFPIELHVNVIRDEAGVPTKVFSIASDASDRVELEERLALAEKLDSVGQLTGGLAHDFNNLLTVIIGGSEMLAEAVAGDDDLTSINQMVMAAAEQGSQLTSRLLAFARRQTLQPRVVDPAPVIDELVKLLRRSLAGSIEIVVEPHGEVREVTIDPNQLEAALMNIMLNGRDAMPHGGRLTITLRDVVVDSSDSLLEPGEYVEIGVSDTGTGMSDEVREHAFDPFFTTKAPGHGNGLGLSMVYGFAQQSGGHAAIESTPGHGTTVCLVLPRALDGASTYAAPLRPVADAPGGHERILVVEDEPMVRRHAVSVLRELGYDVLEAADGPGALAVIDRVGPVDLLFTDVVMPGGLNGVELAEQVTARHPGVPTLLTSGYTDSALDGLDARPIALLAKPYRRGDLARAIRQAIDESLPTG